MFVLIISKSYLYGKAWITLRPHFYPTDSLSLDAKGMDIKEISILKGNHHNPLKYNYDGSTLNIHLDKTYRNTENYTIYIDYTSKPNELKAQGSAAITEAKGLYFINPLGEEKINPPRFGPREKQNRIPPGFLLSINPTRNVLKKSA